MKHFYLFLLLALGIFTKVDAQINIYDNVLFYDGYAGLVDEPTAPDVVRLRNDLFTKKLTPEILSQIGSYLYLDISISAACDNYDRIGNVNLALVPKGDLSYDPATTSRIELGRFITPFMNKNVAPNLVPYSYTNDNVVKILKDTYLNTLYDFWIEFELFGVPYAAQTQIAGCSGRNDVFFGTLNFITEQEAMIPPDNTFLLPLNFKKDLNNYAAGASDEIGTTVRTIDFTLPSQINNAKFYLITSNHGSNSGGEEYNRRWHYISLDGTQILQYKPGESTCEPYRAYNTQGNGIYGASPRTPAQWQSFSNWCPGSVIPIREIELGDLSAGSHSFQISVPDAVFVGGQGYIPVSLYLQGENTVLGIEHFTQLDFDYSPNPTKDIINVNANAAINTIALYDIQGRVLITKTVDATKASINISDYTNGVYFLKIKSEKGEKTKKIIKE
ncbi:MAG: peptide-N-glycosidase F-related protein [Flavobacterium sp.]|nr:peptide-N-glycosidase F-related protein [Flavobacterium sp.]